MWRERWESAESSLHSLELEVRRTGAFSISGGDFDRWDLEIRVGTTGSVRVQMVIEEHSGQKQYVRYRSWPVASKRRLALAALLGIMALWPLFSGVWLVAAVIGGVALLPLFVAFLDCASATFALQRALAKLEQREP